MRRTIFHIVPRATWESHPGEHLRPASLEREGFIHFSTAEQAAWVANGRFRGVRGLVLLACDADELGDSLRWEESEPGRLFPHLYRPLPRAAVHAVLPFEPGPDGVFTVPPSPA